MILQRRILVLLILAGFFYGCTQPFISISLNGEEGDQEAIGQIEGPAPGRTQLPIKEFVKKRVSHGWPLATMRSYAKERKKNVEILSKLLEEPDCGKTLEDGRVCSTVVTTLGAMGGKSALDALINFLEKDEINFRDRRSTVKALGIWANSGKAKNTNQVVKALTQFVRKSVIENSHTKVNSSETPPPKQFLRKVFRQKYQGQRLLKDLQSLKMKNEQKPVLENDLIRAAISALVFASGPSKNEKSIFATTKKEKRKFDSRDMEIDNLLKEIDRALKGDSNNSKRRILKSDVAQAIHEFERITKIGLDCYDQEVRRKLSSHTLSERCQKVTSLRGESSKFYKIKEKLEHKGTAKTH